MKKGNILKHIRHIRNWQIHTVSYNIDVLSGTILNDGSGLLDKGEHVISTYVLKKTVESNGYDYVTLYETQDYIYRVYGREGDDVLKGGNWGKLILGVIK